MLRAGMGKIPNYFKSAQKELLSLGGKLIDKMKEYDKDNIPAKIIDKIEAYIEMEAFTPDSAWFPNFNFGKMASTRCHTGSFVSVVRRRPAQVQKASKACTAMCMWVRAMHKYHQVSVMVEPKKKLLAEATAELEETMQKLAEAQARSRRPFTPSTRLVSGSDGRGWLLFC